MKTTNIPASKASGVKRGLQAVKQEPFEASEEGNKVPRTLDGKAEEKTMKALISQLQQVYIQTNEIKLSVQTEEEWSWLATLPQWESFIKTIKKLDAAKEQTPMVKKLLMNRCDFGTLVFFLL